MRITFILFMLYVHWAVAELKINNEQLTTTSDSLTNNYTSSELPAFQWNDFVDVWDPLKVARIWRNDARGSMNISANCQRDFTDYMTAVSSGDRWALKMVDATGRYTWGLFSDNVFWVGSTDQCREMAAEFLERQNKGDDYRERDVPPFLVGITSVTVILSPLHLELDKSFRIMLGLCLPDSCDIEDVRELIHFAQNRRAHNSSSEIVVENVKNLSTGYSLWEDPVFYVLAIVFVVAVVFVCLGTFYDVSMRYRVLRSRRSVRDTENTMTAMKTMQTDRNIDNEITIAKLLSVKEHNGASDVRAKKTAPKPLSEALLSFSLLLNLSKLCSLNVGDDTLAPIHGLRFISMMWIILGHTCLTVIVVSEARSFRSNAERDFFYQTVSNTNYAVDTFFFMSGCLVSFLYLRTITKTAMQKMKLLRNSCGTFLQFLGMVSYRYVRLTPPYLVVIGLVQVSSSWYYSHTMLDVFTVDYKNCRRFWWRNILYVNTYFDIDERCMMWTWYLANDTLFFIVGAVILIIGVRLLPAAAILTTIILIVSWIVTGTIAWHTEHVPSIADPFAHYDSLYDKPWVRVGPYLLGMVAGWYLYKSNCSLKMPKMVAFACWVLSFFVMLSIVYGLHGSSYGPFMSVAYTALSHSAWAAAVGWVLIACVTGHGGVVNKILSWKLLYPLSRLSYCVYLVHCILIRVVIVNGESSLHLTQGLMAILFLGFAVASYAVALPMSLLFEAPVVSLLRIVHPLRSWNK
ncbi:nose resistant to fluoxetine protein 6-like [Lasioglossum baleicum]|uniref:nose resistant to fluoxetine protein 6-like n=1 Tax=Lasioglossum baleicum TaxID=434251 RepID=UPI003FCE5EBF